MRFADKYYRQSHVAAVNWAKVDDSDPFAFGRLKSELLNQCCSRGLPSEIDEDADRIRSAREKTQRFDPEAAAALKRRLGFVA